jgi:tetratricopeptide (TPR) repeat protein
MIREKTLGPDHPDVAVSLNNLGLLYESQGRYGNAEPLLKRSLAIAEKTLGTNNPDFATSLSSLASLYEAQGRYGDAEPLFKRSLEINEKALGPDHSQVANSLSNLGGLYHSQGRSNQSSGNGLSPSQLAYATMTMRCLGDYELSKRHSAANTL